MPDTPEKLDDTNKPAEIGNVADTAAPGGATDAKEDVGTIATTEASADAALDAGSEQETAAPATNDAPVDASEPVAEQPAVPTDPEPANSDVAPEESSADPLAIPPAPAPTYADPAGETNTDTPAPAPESDESGLDGATASETSPAVPTDSVATDEGTAPDAAQSPAQTEAGQVSGPTEAQEGGASAEPADPTASPASDLPAGADPASTDAGTSPVSSEPKPVDRGPIHPETGRPLAEMHELDDNETVQALIAAYAAGRNDQADLDEEEDAMAESGWRGHLSRIKAKLTSLVREIERILTVGV